MNFTITITGTAALLMHNGRLADPLDPASKALKAATAKRTKTDADHETVSRLEFLGGLYHDPDIGPFLPPDNIWKTLHMAAKKTKQGKQIEEGLIIISEVNPVSYQGPRDVDGLWADKNFVFRKTVRNQTSRIARTRPIFQQWKVAADGVLDEAVMNLADLQAIADKAGNLVGLGDWRPRFGRFTAIVEATR
jgi:hypothetical protein